MLILMGLKSGLNKLWKRITKAKKLKEVKLTQQEWFDALRVPTPVRNKKKYRRKKKHKGKDDQ